MAAKFITRLSQDGLEQLARDVRDELVSRKELGHVDATQGERRGRYTPGTMTTTWVNIQDKE